jgi:hypothetical protein
MIYRTIETAYWDDERVRGLSPEGKLMFLYLITNRHGHMSGIYYLSPQEAAGETGLSVKGVDTLWDTLSACNLARFDRSSGLVWVKKMFDKQARGIKNNKAAATHLATLHKSCLIKEFLEFYAHRKIPYAIPYQEAKPSCLQEQEQEQEQKQDPTALASPAGSGTKQKVSWSSENGWTSITEDHRKRWQAAYPACDIDRQLAAMTAWLMANPAKAHKSNWERFITKWLTKGQDRGGDTQSNAPARGTSLARNKALLKQLSERDSDGQGTGGHDDQSANGDVSKVGSGVGGIAGMAGDAGEILF